MARKIAHGTRNAKSALAMSLEQAHAGVRVGMEIADNLPGNAPWPAQAWAWAPPSAALVLSRLSDQSVREFVISGPQMRQDELVHLLDVLHAALTRHRDALSPMEVLAPLAASRWPSWWVPCSWRPASAA